MSRFDPVREDALEMYAAGRTLLAAWGPLTEPNKLLWVVEDLNEALLDLKLAVLNDDGEGMEVSIEEVGTLIEELRGFRQ